MQLFNRNCYKKCSYYKHLIESSDEIKDLKNKLRVLESIKYLCDDFWNIYKIVNKKSIDIIVAIQTTANRDVEMALFTPSLYNKRPNKEMDLYAQAIYCFDTQYIEEYHLLDISGMPFMGYNHGYGSILISEFINYVKSNNVLYITGMMCVDDPDEQEYQEHKSRLTHFYQKFGFTINEKQEIKLKLK